MASDELELPQWHDVPDAVVRDWRNIFDHSTDLLDVAGACPVCGAHELHRWFQLARSRPRSHMGREWVGTGGQWQWCSHCRSYEHSRGLVPIWWEDSLNVDEAQLRHDPGPLEAALAEALEA
jgi:hypothetical protein